jgi:predicted O-linked N-acetylglucosamine transferase (SPINDLY family)
MDLIGKAIEQNPACASYHSNLGAACRVAGETERAIAAYRRAIQLRPDFAEAHGNLGLVLAHQGQLAEAIAAYRSAIQLKPDFADAHNNLGVALRRSGQTAEAITAFRSAIRHKPDFGDAHGNLGHALHEQGELELAIAAYRSALHLKPDCFEILNDLGNALQIRGQLGQAIAAYQAAIRCKPESAEAHNNLGFALWQGGQTDQAIAACRRAIELKPDLAEAHNNLGNALKDKGRLDEAIAAYREAIAILPSYAGSHSNLIYILHFHPGFDARAIAEEHRCWNRQHAEPLRKFHRLHANDRDPERRLRIGYVSPDFFAQAESFFVVPLFEAHDHSRYEIHAYASVLRPDQTTERLRRSVCVWHDVLGCDDEKLAEKIRHDGIDILVDLTMHMAHNRLPLFARKPAPVQVTWLAYPGSTGLETIDYRITDAYQDPPSSGTEGYSEQGVRLPDSWCCYDPMSEIEPVPAEAEREGGFVRFGSLNNFCKLNDPLLRTWVRLLTEVPESRLVLLAAEGSPREDLLRALEAMGVDGGRVEFVGRCSREQYLRSYDRIDIALDTLPYNGITTTLDALWMGVPVVSLTGNTAAGRVGLSLLTTLGLPELATTTPDEFVRIAAGLAGDLPRLNQLRSTLRERMQASPLMDAPGFARDIEAAYRTMWRTWCEQPEAPPCQK